MMTLRHKKANSVGSFERSDSSSTRMIQRVNRTPPISHQVDSQESKFYKAVIEDDISSILSGLETENLDVNWQNPLDGERTALHRAVLEENEMVVALLLGKGADACIRDINGKTSLNVAIDKGNNKILNLLASKTITTIESYKSSQLSPRILAQKGITQSQEEQQPDIHFSRSHSEGFISLEKKKKTASIINDQILQLLSNKHTPNLYRMHVPRQSAISEMLCISHFQTIYNIFVAVFLIALTNILIRNYYDQGVILDFSLLFWAFGDFLNALFIWCGLFIFSFSAFFLQKGIVNGALKPAIAYTIYGFAVALVYLGLPYYVRERGYPPATAFAVSCEMVRLSMKMHSYLMVNRALRSAKEKKDPDPSVEEYPSNVNFWNFFEFLWFPTLIYQTSYPRTNSVRIGYVLKRFGEVLLCITFVYAILIRYCIPHYNEMIGDIKSLFLGVFHVMMPGIAMNLLGFYCILHSWLNAFAELTRFGDRHFYSDWWTATSWAVYYRKWNTVVHNFLHRHIFMDCVATFHLSKNTSMWITFLISAVVHEYIIAIGLGFYKPILFIMFVFPGVFFIYLTRVLKGSRMWNIFMWAMLIVGHGMLVGLYTRAWHFHYHENAEPRWYDYFWIVQPFTPMYKYSFLLSVSSFFFRFFMF